MSRLNQVGESLNDLDFYVYGTRGPVMFRAFQLAKREKEGDYEAKIELEQLIAYQKAHQTPTLVELQENFGNSYTPLYFPVSSALENL